MRRINVGHIEIGPQEKKAVIDVLDSGRISEGAKTREFEEKWAKYIGTKYCVATSSGTAALITALTSLKYIYALEKRPKVITSPLTYISDANAIKLSGFEPVFVDIDPDSYCITPEAIEKHLRKAKDKNKYSIILAVDLMGYPARMAEIKIIAKKYNLLVIDDAAEAHGSVEKGKKCGSQADAGIFSFYIAHNLSAGEMGAITTNDLKVYQMAKKVKANGRYCKCNACLRYQDKCPGLHHNKDKDDFDPRFLHDVIGYNFKVMEFQTAIACVQISKVDKIIKQRQNNVRQLNEGLRGFSGILQLPLFDENVSYLAYPLVVKKPEIILRKELRAALEKKGIETRPIFGCIPTQQPAYAYLKKHYQNILPNADFIGRNGFYIACHQYLEKNDINYIIDSFHNILENNNG
ncbi:MAG TPA: DegT/DnrJ/EryC1/StrS family aminotransferase [Candidatus Omnitrophota bacterium]|mgnify:CR=1 FL=1|nr:DegT/DnrJ/EryC1/StrS family aminotransferase [Candidatus Omnitrophota bacterium]